MSKTTDAFVEQNRERLLDELKEFLRIPSIARSPSTAAISTAPRNLWPTACAM
jgi:hypothetical protein